MDLLASHSRAGYWSLTPRRGQVHVKVNKRKTEKNDNERTARKDKEDQTEIIKYARRKWR